MFSGEGEVISDLSALWPLVLLWYGGASVFGAGAWLMLAFEKALPEADVAVAARVRRSLDARRGSGPRT
jgi:hypothetical protein